MTPPNAASVSEALRIPAPVHPAPGQESAPDAAAAFTPDRTRRRAHRDAPALTIATDGEPAADARARAALERPAKRPASTAADRLRAPAGVPRSLARQGRAPAPLALPRAGTLRRSRVTLADGARTTVYVAAYAATRTELRVALLDRPRPLERWCAQRGVADAIVGGFFVRPSGRPLGEVRTHGVARAHVPTDGPWDGVRACVHIEGGVARIARRNELPAAPRGDLLQAGPLLVAGSRVVYNRSVDTEGFRRGAQQFDSDITAGRHPRAALGLTDDALVALACDGRAQQDAGLTLEELAALLAALGCHTALNLDGGGSTSLVTDGRLRNQPRRDFERPEPGGRAIPTALLFAPAVESPRSRRQDPPASLFG